MSDNTGITQRGDKFRAEAYDRATRKRVYRTFPTKAAAKAWRRDMQVKIARGEYHVGSAALVRDAWEEWEASVTAGIVRSRGGERYKPGVVRSYAQLFQGRLLKRFGTVKVGDLRRDHIQRFADELVAEGLAAQTVRNHVNALRVLMKYCIRQNAITMNPCNGVELPSGGTARDRIAPPSEAVALLGQLTRPDDRAIYATAFFAGLRRGELMALRWEDVHFADRTITVRQSYDPTTRAFVAPKSKAGARTLGMPDLLGPYLADLGTDEGLCFPSPKGVPFNDSSLAKRTAVDWLTGGIGLHEARHTYASLMIAAGVNIKTISEWMGHSSVNITLDRYGHLLPGSGKVALGLLNDFLAKELS